MSAVAIRERIAAIDWLNLPEPPPSTVEPAPDDSRADAWYASVEASRPAWISDELFDDIVDRFERYFDLGSPITWVPSDDGTFAVGTRAGGEWVCGRKRNGEAVLKKLSPEGAAPAEAPKPSRFCVQSAQAFAGELKPREWLVEDVVTSDAELIAVPGPSRAGKSFVLIELAAAIHRGTPWHGRAVKRQRVVYVVAEGVGDFRYRMAAYARHHGVAMRDMFSVIAAAPNLLKADQATELATAIRESGGADVIIFDTLTATSAGSDQNATAEMGAYVDVLRMIRQATGAKQTWYSHHSGKDEGKGQRGSTVLVGACDTELWVSRSAGDLRTVELTKSKAGEERPVLTFRLKRVVLGSDDRGKEFDSCVIEASESAMPMHTRAPRKRPRKGAALIVLQCLEKHFPADAPHVDDVFNACAEALRATVKRPERLREYFRDAVTTLADVEIDKWLHRFPGERISLHAVEPGVDAFENVT